MPVLGIDASRTVKSEKTGVEWYSYFLIQAMEKCTPEGWKVRLYTPSIEHGNMEAWKHKDWSWRVLKWIGRGWTQGRLSIAMMKSPPDVLFVPSHVIPLIHPASTITTIHDVVFLSHPEVYDPADLASQKRGLEFALHFAKRIIVPSQATKDEVIQAGGGKEQIIVVPHGVDLANGYKLDTNGTDRDSENSLRILTNSRFILFIGRIERKKNVLGLLHAFRKLVSHPEFSSLKLVLAGQLGYGGEDVLQAIDTFRMKERVLHLGWIPRDVYLALLSKASLLVLPSFGEGFGLPVLEAMAAGVPVVCSNIAPLRELGGNAVQYVNPHDPEIIAHAMDSILKNEMLQSEMVRRGKERAAEFSWERAAKETWNVITSV